MSSTSPPPPSLNVAGPVHAVGLYIASASLFIFALLLFDVLGAIRSRRSWFPCSWMSINALSLSVITIATKLPNDISTPMLGGLDQLSKLSGTVLTCVTIGFALPSVGCIIHEHFDAPGEVTQTELMNNLVALGVLVITLVVNVSTQLKSGVISMFHEEHIVALVATLLSFVFICSAALSAIATTAILSMKVDSMIRDEPQVDWEAMRSMSKQAWMLARTGSKQYVISRSSIGSAMGASIFTCVGTLIIAMARTSKSEYVTRSDYGWTVWLIFIAQLPAIMLGSMITCVRWWRPIIFQEQRLIKFEVEDFWLTKLMEFKRQPASIRNQWWTRGLSHARVKLANILLLVQRLSVLTSKFVCLTSNHLLYLGRKSNFHASDDYPGTWVVCLDHENPGGLWTSNSATVRPMETTDGGSMDDIKELRELLYESSRSFDSLKEFRSVNVERLHSDKSCSAGMAGWNLEAATLLTIITALEELIFTSAEVSAAHKAYDQAADMMRLIEEIHVRTLATEAAEVVISGLQFRKSWLHVGLGSRELGKERTKLQLCEGADIMDYASYSCLRKGSLDQAIETVKLLKLVGSITAEEAYDRTDFIASTAGNNLYKVSGTVLEQISMEGEAKQLQAMVRRKLADVVGACLSNLPITLRRSCFFFARYHLDGRCGEVVEIVEKGKKIWEDNGWPWPSIQAQGADASQQNRDIHNWIDRHGTPFWALSP